jgi:hypothetical protein
MLASISSGYFAIPPKNLHKSTVLFLENLENLGLAKKSIPCKNIVASFRVPPSP